MHQAEEESRCIPESYHALSRREKLGSDIENRFSRVYVSQLHWQIPSHTFCAASTQIFKIIPRTQNKVAYGKRRVILDAGERKEDYSQRDILGN